MKMFQVVSAKFAFGIALFHKAEKQTAAGSESLLSVSFNPTPHDAKYESSL